MRTRWMAVPMATIAISTVLACGDAYPTAPEGGEGGPPPRASISDAVHDDGNEHFFWLPPIVGDPGGFNGAFDGTQAPEIEICEWSGSACATVLATYTMTTGVGSEVVRVVSDDEQYVVNWHTNDFGLDPVATYRIRALVGGTELGHADVDVVNSGKELKNVETGEYIALKDGRTLPIKFRIEDGAVDGGAVCSDAPHNVWATHWDGAFQGIRAYDASATEVGAGTPFAGADIVDLGPDCLLYVASYSQNRVWRYTTDMTFVDEFATANMSHATFMAFDSDGNLYVSNYTSSSISKYLADGTPDGIFATVGSPRDIAFDAAGNLYVARRSGSVDRFLPDGTPDGTFASAGLHQPVGLAFDEVGNLYVSNETSNTIRKFSPSGADLGDFVATGNGAAWDSAIKIDADGVLWVVNNNGNIRRFRLSDGAELPPAPWVAGTVYGVAGIAVWNELFDPNLR